MQKRCKRRVRNPMGCITTRMPLGIEKASNLALAYRSAMDAFTRGAGDRPLWQTLADALNMGRKMCGDGLGSEYEPQMIAAQYALIAARDRFWADGRWSFGSDETHTILAAMDVLDEQYKTSSPHYLKSVVMSVRRSIAAGDVIDKERL